MVKMSHRKKLKGVMTKKYLLILGLVVYIFSTSATFAFFGFRGRTQPKVEKKQPITETTEKETALGTLLKIDPAEPKDEPCPLNGKLYTKTEKEAWSKRRPLAVMIENSPDARPQSGLTRADVIYEAVAEGGITRFMSLYYCDAQRDDVVLAPVRSARTYFIDWASGYNRPMYVHVGGANLPGPANALGQLSDYGWVMQNDINQFSVGYPTFIRNKNRLSRPVATEHTMQTSTEKLWAVAEKRGWTNINPETEEDWAEGYKGLSYMPVGQETKEGNVLDVKYDFWSGYKQFSAEWRYDPEKRLYLRFTGGEPHKDLNNDQQLFAKTVVVLKTKEKGPIDELRHLLYQTTGKGDALIFSNGQAYQAKWAKLKRTSELKFYDKLGKPFKFNRGLIWISVLDNSNEVTY